MGGIPKIFCLDLPSHSGRRTRLERRLAHHGLLERTTFFDSIMVEAPRSADPKWKDAAGRACFAGHLKAMRLLLADSECAKTGAIICENDVMLHDEFVPRVEAVLRNLPPGAPHCSLGYLVGRWDPAFTWAGRDPSRENVCRMVPWALYGMHMHWISPPYAREVLERWGDLEVGELPSIPEEIARGEPGDSRATRRWRSRSRSTPPSARPRSSTSTSRVRRRGPTRITPPPRRRNSRRWPASRLLAGRSGSR